MTKSLGERIRELREAHDLSLRELARKIEKSAAYLSDVELGRRQPSDEVIQLIAAALKLSEDIFFAHDTRPPLSEIRRRVARDPMLGFAFRRVLDSNISADDLIKFLREKESKKREGDSDK